MKTTILLLFLALASCSKDSTSSFTAQLPPETQTGANTFGAIINGQVFYPRDGNGNFGGGTADRAILFWGSGDGPNYAWNEIDCSNFKTGKPVSRIIIHLQGLAQNGVGDYIWHLTNFQKSTQGLMQNNVYANIFDANSNSWKYYGSYENSGKVTITKYDFVNKIISGNFNGKLRLKDGTEEIEILQGRFDFNLNTLSTTLFP